MSVHRASHKAEVGTHGPGGMTQWEYKVETLEDRLMPALRAGDGGVDERRLNDLGGDGWELVDSIADGACGGSGAATRTLIFKRPT